MAEVVTGLLLAFIGLTSGILGAVIGSVIVCSKLAEAVEEAEKEVLQQIETEQEEEDQQVQGRFEDAVSRFTKNNVIYAWWIGESSVRENNLEE